jgi:hypothetical protein
VSRDGMVVRADAVFRWEREEEVAATLREGLESRITFTLRAWEKGRGIASLLGDRLLAETSVTRSAYPDVLEGTYTIEEADGARSSYRDPAALMRQFFSATGVTLRLPEDSRGRPSYVTARVLFEPVRLMPPLTIVSIAGAAATHTTPWVRAEIHQ